MAKLVNIEAIPIDYIKWLRDINREGDYNDDNTICADDLDYLLEHWSSESNREMWRKENEID